MRVYDIADYEFDTGISENNKADPNMLAMHLHNLSRDLKKSITVVEVRL